MQLNLQLCSDHLNMHHLTVSPHTHNNDAQLCRHWLPSRLLFGPQPRPPTTRHVYPRRQACMYYSPNTTGLEACYYPLLEWESEACAKRVMCYWSSFSLRMPSCVRSGELAVSVTGPAAGEGEGRLGVRID
jgi:hypothetical protein